MNTGYTVLVCSRPSTCMSRQPFVWHDIVITLHSLAEVYRILVTLTPQRPLQGVWLLPVDHPSHQVFITCQGHRGETCRLNQPGEKLYKYLNFAIKTFLGFTVKCSSSPTNSWSYTRVCKFYWWVESLWLLLHKFWSHFGIFRVKNHNEKSHFQTFQHMVLACIHYRDGYTK